MSNRLTVPLLQDEAKGVQSYSTLYVTGLEKGSHVSRPNKKTCCVRSLLGGFLIFVGVLTVLLLISAAIVLVYFIGHPTIMISPIADGNGNGSASGNVTLIDEDAFTPEEENDTLLFSSSLVKSPQKKMLRASTTKTILVETTVGKVQGVEMVSRLGRKYNAFLKIPYARPPTGKRRFMPPQPISGWQGTFDGTKTPSECIQKVKYAATDEAAGEEDCLYMSIYTPKLPSGPDDNSELLPVMFYIHGGGFTDGNGTRYGAKYFMDENVVLITFQYRLAAFGLLNSNDGDIRGNMAFKDQVQALKFTRKIIPYFKGDPERITIFGNSAGGMSVGYHLLSPLSAGLFSRAIAQSGNAVGAMGSGVDRNPELTAAMFAKRFNCSYGSTSSGSSKEKLSKCLRKVDAAQIAILRPEQAKFALTIEQEADDAFMVELPLDVLRQNKLNNVPLIAGANSGEGLPQSIMLLKSPVTVNALNKNWPQLGPTLFQYNSTAFDVDAMSYRVRDFFFGGKPVSNDTQKNLTGLCSDRFMIHATKVQSTFHAVSNPVYLYYLTKRPAKSYSDSILKGFPPGDYGVAHADELQYMFLYNGYPEINTTSPWYNISTAFVKLWTHFGATGSPGEDWLPFEPKKQELWYNMDDRRSMTDAIVNRMKLWDSYSGRDLTYE